MVSDGSVRIYILCTNLSPLIDVLFDRHSVLQPVVGELALELAHRLAQDGHEDGLWAE